MHEKNKITILHVIYSFNLGGSEDNLVKLINRMNRDQFINIICCLTKNGTAMKRVEIPDLKVYECFKKDGIDLAPVRKILRIVREHGVDVIHGRAWVTLIPIVLTKILAGKDLKLVFGFHGQNYSDVKHNKRNLKRLILQNLLLRKVDIVYTLNSSMRKYFSCQAGISEDKISIIPNGIDISENNCGQNESESLREKYGIKRNDIVIGFGGRMAEVKNLPLLVRSFSQVKSKIPNVKLLLMGSGPEENRIRGLVSELLLTDSVIFTGWVENPSQYYQLMDLYVQPSFFEGMSNSIANAMLNQIPIVATNVGGNPDLVLHNETGFLVEPDNIKGLTEAILELAAKSDLRRSLGMKAAEYVKSKYSMNKMVRSYEEIYYSLTRYH
jgi:glycosyltransferase involved in cell wall biosynthesis